MRNTTLLISSNQSIPIATINALHTFIPTHVWSPGTTNPPSFSVQTHISRIRDTTATDTCGLRAGYLCCCRLFGAVSHRCYGQRRWIGAVERRMAMLRVSLIAFICASVIVAVAHAHGDHSEARQVTSYSFSPPFFPDAGTRGCPGMWLRRDGGGWAANFTVEPL